MLSGHSESHIRFIFPCCYRTTVNSHKIQTKLLAHIASGVDDWAAIMPLVTNDLIECVPRMGRVRVI